MRVLIIDDESAVHEAYRQCLESSARSAADSSLEAMAASLFADNSPAPISEAEPTAFECVYASQGLDGIALVEKSLSERQPFHVAFIDVRMPPGIDGKETAKRIRALDPEINIVIVSAYSDHGVTEIARVAGPPDKIFYISKPFTADEVCQMATALGQRWQIDIQLKNTIADLEASEARATHIAGHDFLTGAPNRRQFQQQLIVRLNEMPAQFGLILVDLDRFKNVNDTLGHGAGDELIISVYQRIKDILPPQSLLARLGGDEFGIIHPAKSEDEADKTCHAVIAACTSEYAIHGCAIDISASAGCLFSGVHPNRDSDELIRFVDIALYSAKHGGGGRFCMFDSAMDASSRFRHDIEIGLRSAIANNELSLCYQPIVERESLNIVGFEALIRWHSPEHGDISPNIFIPIAEEGPLIQSIGDWVMRNAIKESRNWPDQYVSVNLSVRQMSRIDLVDQLCALAAEFSVPHEKIQIEVTETALFENAQLAATKLQALQDLGFRIALDDFGTGYSTMFNVKNFAIDCIKIDKSFVDDLGNDTQSSAIVGSITHLARTLGLSVVAEGVETEIQCQALRVSGCSHLQGYLFGKPENASDTLSLIDDDEAARQPQAAHQARIAL